jgi:uncharacterized protein DUF4157
VGKTVTVEKPPSHNCARPAPVQGIVSHRPDGAYENTLCGLQRTVGNQAVLLGFESGVIQAKLRVSQPGDPDEAEADRAADQVVAATHAPKIQRKCACGGTGTPCAKCEEEESGTIHRSVASQILRSSQLSLQRAPAGPAPANTPDQAGNPPKPSPTPSHAHPLIVEDDAKSVAPHQMRKSAFIALLRADACATADAVLTSVGRTTKSCPYIEKWLAFYEKQSSDHIERAILKYAPETATARTAHEAIRLTAMRVQRAAMTWAKTGKVTGLPEDMAGQIPGQGVLGAVQSFASSSVGGAILGFLGASKPEKSAADASADKSPAPTVSRKATGGSAGSAPAHDAGAVRSQLGAGHSLDSHVQSQMSTAFGHDFSGVRVHTDSRATALSSDLNARAFTIGSDVAFASGEYQPGTLVGDALIAHELAHVVQQSAAAPSSPMSKVADHSAGSTEPAASQLENDADLSAVGAVASIWAGAKRGLVDLRANAIPRLRSGLRLQRCPPASRDVKPPVPVAPVKLPAEPTQGHTSTPLPHVPTAAEQIPFRLSKGFTDNKLSSANVSRAFRLFGGTPIANELVGWFAKRSIRVTPVFVSSSDEMPGKDHAAKGTFRQTGRGTYNVYVLAGAEDSRFVPIDDRGTRQLKTFIVDADSESMADTLFHEMLHVWFENAVHDAVYGFETGHTAQVKPTEIFGDFKTYDESNYDPRFLNRLKQFDSQIREVKKKEMEESASPPVQRKAIGSGITCSLPCRNGTGPTMSQSLVLHPFGLVIQRAPAGPPSPVAPASRPARPLVPPVCTPRSTNCTSSDDPDKIICEHKVTPDTIEKPGDTVNISAQFACKVRSWESLLEKSDGTSLNLREPATQNTNTFARSWNGKKQYGPSSRVIETFLAEDGEYRHRFDKLLFAYKYVPKTKKDKEKSTNMFVTGPGLISNPIKIKARSFGGPKPEHFHYTAENVAELGDIVHSEVGIGNADEKKAVAWAMRNQMIRVGTAKVASAFKVNQVSRKQTVKIDPKDLPDEVRRKNESAAIADEILKKAMSDDTTSGANRWWSPDSMPKEGESCAGMDCKGGLVTVKDLTGKNRKVYSPSWAKDMTRVKISGVRNWRLMLYKL